MVDQEGLSKSGAGTLGVGKTLGGPAVGTGKGRPPGEGSAFALASELAFLAPSASHPRDGFSCRLS